MPAGRIIFGLLTKPWFLAATGGATAYALYQKNKDQRARLKDAKLELLEQQRTIDRLRADLGRTRHRLDEQQLGAEGI